MANNSSQATLSPSLPAALFHEEELQSLAIACGLSAEMYGDDVYLFAEECFSEVGEDENGRPVDCLVLMQEKLRRLDPAAYPPISLHGASSCSKMRPDEFGGFAHFITRDEIRSGSTWEWLREQTDSGGDLAEAARACHTAVALATDGRLPRAVTDDPAAEGRPYSVLLLYPDYADDGGSESYYAFVTASDPIEAVALAQQLAVAAQEGIEIEPDDFSPLLVIEGHHYGEPLFNK